MEHRGRRGPGERQREAPGGPLTTRVQFEQGHRARVVDDDDVFAEREHRNHPPPELGRFEDLRGSEGGVSSTREEQCSCPPRRARLWDAGTCPNGGLGEGGGGMTRRGQA